MTAALELERDGDRVAEGEIRYVAIEPKSREKTPIPDKIRDAVGPYLSSPD
jgi:acyl-CoA thioesterase FadM